MLIQMVMNDPPKLCEVAPDVPPVLGAAIDGALRRSPETRHRDMQELLEALVEAAEVASIPCVPPARSLPAGVL